MLMFARHFNVPANFTSAGIFFAQRRGNASPAQGKTGERHQPDCVPTNVPSIRDIPCPELRS